jgi:hypothetical protein
MGLLVPCGVLLFIGIVAWCCGGIGNLGSLGDSFNILGTLFTGLAFGAVVLQLWMQHEQIEQERKDRRRSERITALTALSERTYNKIVFERGLLLKVVSSLENVSFMHDSDRTHLAGAISAKEGMIQDLTEEVRNWQTNAQTRQSAHSFGNLSHQKQLSEHQKALPMMKQMKLWMDDLAKYETELRDLLAKGEQPADSLGE